MSVAVASVGNVWSTFLSNPSGESITAERFDSTSSATSITLDEPLNEALAALDETYQSCSRPKWDGEDAAPVTEGACAEAERILRLLPPSMPLPEIVAEPNGEIGLEWRKGKGRVFVITLNGNRCVAYAGLSGGNTAHGQEYFGNDLPSVIIGNIRRIYS